MANIMIVDDALVMRKKLKIILAAGGHVVVGEAGNGAEAVNVYRECKPDLVTMDITMPVMDGVNSVKQILAIDSSAKIVMVSAVNQQNMVFEAIEAGARHYIVKPINEQKLLETVDQVLKSSSKNQAIPAKENPFSIINNSGEFIITIHRLLSDDDLASLNKAVEGMLFINPLIVTIDLSAAPEHYGANFEKMIPVITRIKSSNGKVNIIK